MIYYVLYSFLFIIGLCDFFTSAKEIKKKLYYSTIFIFYLFRALRWDTGCDFPQFLRCFQDVNISNVFSYYRYGTGSETMEFGYTLLNLLIKSIIPSYTFFLLITEGFILYSYSRLIKKYISKYQLVALSILLFSTEIFSVRQTIAIGILCYSYTYIIEQNLKKFIISILLAFSIHDAMLFMLPMYWIGRLRFNAITLIVVYLILVALRAVMVEYIPIIFALPITSTLSGGLTEQYVIANAEFNRFPLMQIVSGIFILFLYWYCRRTAQENEIKKYDFWGMLYFGYLCTNILGSLPNLEIFYRLSGNFALAYPMLLTFIIARFRTKSFIIPIIIYIGFIFTKAIKMPCFDEEHIHYKIAYQPYFSVFERPYGKLIRQAPWPYRNR